jgi:hypothetical protein
MKGNAFTEVDYAAIGLQKDPRYCCVKDMGDLERPGDLSVARPVGPRFPDGLKVSVAQDCGDLVPDFVDNIFRVLIVSEKARRFLEGEGIGKNRAEYLPIVLGDKRGKSLGEAFFIVNILTAVGCFDWDRSTYKTYKGSPREIMSVKILHVRAEAIPEDAMLFRVGERLHEIVIRTDLLGRLRAAGCDGLEVIPMGEKRLL